MCKRKLKNQFNCTLGAEWCTTRAHTHSGRAGVHVRLHTHAPLFVRPRQFIRYSGCVHEHSHTPRQTAPLRAGNARKLHTQARARNDQSNTELVRSIHTRTHSHAQKHNARAAVNHMYILECLRVCSSPVREREHVRMWLRRSKCGQSRPARAALTCHT